MSDRHIYLDYNATAPLAAEARALMQDILAETGNASSLHGFGRAARSRVETAREQVAALAGVQAPQVVFTSGATEANNMVLQAFRGQRILVSAIEHPSVLEAAPDAELIPVTADGVVDLAAYEALLAAGPAPALVSVMMVNNETGAIQPIGKIAKLAKKAHPQVHVHSDAVQAAGRIPIDFGALHLDYMSLSAHKMGGPQGAGALIVAPGARNPRLLFGGGQEKRQRAGTENVAAIAGFGAAAEKARENLDEFQKIATLRGALEDGLRHMEPETLILSHGAPRVANTTAVILPGVRAQTFLISMDLEGIAVSSGSACSSGTVKPSHVGRAMGVPDAQLEGLIRVSLGPGTVRADIDSFIAACSKVMARLNSRP